MSIEKVIEAVCKYAGITEDNLSMPRKSGCPVVWRRIAAYICYDYCEATQQAIANHLGYAKHENTKFHVDKLRFWMANQHLAPKDEIIACRNIMYNLGL
jgi:chromosomal replication initiation ATPase DnaA